MTTANPSEIASRSNATERETIELHVKRVPRAIWLKSRQQALVQKMSFREYVIRVLEAACVEQHLPAVAADILQ